MNSKREEKKAVALLRLRKMKAQTAAMKKAVCLCQQKEAFQAWQHAKKHEQDCKTARDKNAAVAVQGICAKESVRRTDLEYEYANFSWESERLKELQKTAVEKAKVHENLLEVTQQARMEHIRCENKSSQAAHLREKARLFRLQQLLHAESEENEEIATTRYVLKSLKQ